MPTNLRTITQLPSASTPLVGDELFELSQTIGTKLKSRKVSLNQLQVFLSSSSSSSSSSVSSSSSSSSVSSSSLSTSSSSSSSSTALPWEVRFDNTYWDALAAPAPGVTWDGSKYFVTASGPSQYGLERIGTWANGYKPTKIRVTFTLTAGTVDFNLTGVFPSWGTITNQTSGMVEWSISYPGMDIYRLYFSGMDAGATLEITNIEFLV